MNEKDLEQCQACYLCEKGVAQHTPDGKPITPEMIKEAKAKGGIPPEWYASIEGCEKCFTCEKCVAEEANCESCFTCEKCVTDQGGAGGAGDVRAQCKNCYTCEKCVADQSGCQEASKIMPTLQPQLKTTAVTPTSQPQVTEVSRQPQFTGEMGVTYFVFLTNDCNLRCHVAGTKILMANLTWKNIEDIKSDEEVIGFNTSGSLKISKVIHTGDRSARTLKLHTDKGSIQCSIDHKWYYFNGVKYYYKEAQSLMLGSRIKSLPIGEISKETENYKIGYLSGYLRGDGWIHEKHNSRDTKGIGFDSVDKEAIDRISEYLNDLFDDIKFTIREETTRSNKTIYRLRVWTEFFEVVKSKLTQFMDNNSEYLRGFLGGIFDSEGNISSVIKLYNTDEDLLRKIVLALNFHKFSNEIKRYKNSCPYIQVSSKNGAKLRFIQLANPAINRKRRKLIEGAVPSRQFANVTGIIEADIETVYNIQTETGNYIAENGLYSANCDYCYATKSPPTMTSETIDATLDFIFNKENERFPRRNINIQFFGGEPTYKWNLLTQFVEKANIMTYKLGRQPVKFGMTTNCTLLNRKRLQWLRHHNIGLLLSIDGGQKTHNKHRKTRDGKGSFRLIPLELLKKYYPNCEIRPTIMPDTVEDFPKNLEWFYRNGFYTVATEVAYEADWDDEAMEKARVMYEKLGDIYIQRKKANLPQWMKFIEDRKSCLGMTHQTGEVCGIGKNTVGIDALGNLYSCQRYASYSNPALKLGNIYDGWDKIKLAQANDFRREYMHPSYESDFFCDECSARFACRGCCNASNYQVMGDRRIILPNACKFQRLWTGIALKVLAATGELWSKSGTRQQNRCKV